MAQSRLCCVSNLFLCWIGLLLLLMAFDSTVPVSVRCEDAIIGERCATSSIGITKNRPTHGLTVPDEHLLNVKHGAG